MAAATPALSLSDPWTLAKSRFLKDLEPSERQLFDNATLENIYSATNNTNLQDAESSKTRSVVRKLGPLFYAIESYGTALDTFAQIAPLYLSPIWGSIRVVLVSARSHAKFYDKIVDTLSRIGDILPRFRDYERIYDRNKHQRLTEALSNTYLDIIVICTKFRQCLRDYQASSFRRVFKPLSLNKQIEDAVETFRRHKENVGEEARVCHMIEAAEQRNYELVLVAAARRDRLLSKLSNVDCLDRHRKLKKSRHEGTGVWLAGRPEYQQWEQLEASSVLCCYGIPGCGKSVLASSILDNLGTARSPTFYYCDYADKRTLEPGNIFGTLTRQLLENINPIPEDLALEIEKAPQNGENILNPEDALKFLIRAAYLNAQPLYIVFDGLDETSERSQKIVYMGLKKLLISSQLSVKLLITGREEVISQLKLPPSFWYRKILISATTITLDIDSYIRASTKRRISDGSLVITEPGLESLIVDKLVTGAAGMFLWVEFQLNDLCDAESDHGIKTVLHNLPKNLSETYDRLLDRIEGSERKEMIKRLFKWIVCARQPLHVDELRECVAFTLYDKEWSQEKIPTDFKRLVRACSNLVVVNEESQVVELAHYTVQQYLLRPDGTNFNFTMEEANVMAGQICVAYLNFSNFETQMVRYKKNATSELVRIGKLASHSQLIAPDNPARVAVDAWKALRSPPPISTDLDLTKFRPLQKRILSDFSQFALLEYVRTHWLWHSKHFQDPRENDVADKSRQYHLFKILVLNRNLLFDFRPWGEFNEERREIFTKEMLGWALTSNHAYLIKVIWVTSLSMPGYINPYLMIASDWKMLLQKREIQSECYKLPKRLFEDLESLVIDSSSSEPSTPGWLYSKAVFASRRDLLESLQACLNLTAYNNAVPQNLQLHLLLEAAASGALSVVKSFLKITRSIWHLLVEHGGDYLNMLDLSILAGQLDVVRLFHENGYFVLNLVPDVQSFFRLLAVNLDAGNLFTLECLLYIRHHGMVLQDAHIIDLFRRAIGHGNIQMIETLLDHLTDPTSRQTFYGPLAEAIRSSQLAIVDLILRRFYSSEDEYCMPLTLAACSGSLDMVELVLKFNPNAARSLSSTLLRDPRDSYVSLCPTPLYMACYYDHLPIIKVLMHYGASITVPSPVVLNRLAPHFGNKELLRVEINHSLENLKNASFSLTNLGFETQKVVRVQWETPLALISKAKMDKPSYTLLGEIKMSAQVVEANELPSDLSMMVNLLSNGAFLNWDAKSIAPVIKDLIHDDPSRNLPGQYDKWAGCFCWALDHDNIPLQNLIMNLASNAKELLCESMFQTLQSDALQRIQELRNQEWITYGFDGVYHTSSKLIDAAQNRGGLGYDKLRDILVDDGITAAKTRSSDVLTQIISSCITYSRLNWLSDKDYYTILKEANYHDRFKDYGNGLLEDLFRIFAFPSPASTPLDDAMEAAKSVGARDVVNTMWKCMDEAKTSGRVSYVSEASSIGSAMNLTDKSVTSREWETKDI